MCGFDGNQAREIIDLLTEIRDNTRPLPLRELTDEEAAEARAKWDAIYGGGRPAHQFVTPHREALDRLKAAERCVLALTEVLTGEKHDGVFDYDMAREHLVAAVERIRGDAG